MIFHQIEEALTLFLIFLLMEGSVENINVDIFRKILWTGAVSVHERFYFTANLSYFYRCSW
jgi:hypothetical protein